MTEFVAWHDRPWADQNLTMTYTGRGFAFTSLSVYGAPDKPYYAAVLVKRDGTVRQHCFPKLSQVTWFSTLAAEQEAGYQPFLLLRPERPPNRCSRRCSSR